MIRYQWNTPKTASHLGIASSCDHEVESMGMPPEGGILLPLLRNLVADSVIAVFILLMHGFTNDYLALINWFVHQQLVLFDTKHYTGN